jgi:hypothetical protein
VEDLRKFFKDHKKAEIHEFLSTYFTRVNNQLIYEKGREVRVYKSCPLYRNCTVQKCNCLAIKLTLIKEYLFDLHSAIAHDFLTHRLRHTQGAMHFNKLLGYFKDLHTNQVILASSYETLFWQDCPTLKDVLEKKRLSKLYWKAITFQFISAFSLAQRRCPGFCHNDCHVKNLLIVPNTSKVVCYAYSAKKRKVAVDTPFLLRVIDFDLMTLHTGPSSLAGKEFFKYTSGNTMVDFFRFASSVNSTLLLIQSRTKHIPSYAKEWRDFVLRYLPPSFIYQGTSEETSIVLDSNGGIPSKIGGKYLQSRFGPDRTSILLHMLDDSYFDELSVS